MRVTDSFTLDKYDENRKIIIYGAGRYGELAYWGLNAVGLLPDLFIDKSLAGNTFLNIPVIGPEDISSHKEDIFLIASYNYFKEMYDNLQDLGCTHVFDIYELLLSEYNESVLTEQLKEEKNNTYKYKSVIDHVNYDGLVISHCELVVTEKCTLRCIDCANLMQYYKAPENIECDDIIDSFTNFLNSVDLLLELRILGGEPFIYKELDRVINAFVNNRKIKHITIYTNSTIVPSDSIFEALKNEKVTLHMSNYGRVSRHIDDLRGKCETSGINYYIHDYSKWTDVGKPVIRAYSPFEVKKIYDSCFMRKCYTFYRGRFFVCPRSAHGERLGFFENKESEYIDFTSKDESLIMVRRNKMKEIMRCTDFLTACMYCKGSSNFSDEVEAGRQK